MSNSFTRLSTRVGATLTMLVACVAAQAQFTDTITTPNFSYDINFTNDSPYNCASPMAGDDLDYFPTTQAQNVANALDNNNVSSPGNPPGYHVGLTDLGFLAPDFAGSTDEIFIWNCSPNTSTSDCDSGNAPATRINLPTTNYCTTSERNLRRVTGHETTHHSQFAYITFGQWLNWGRTAIEGSARMMEDHVYADIDGDSSLSYWSQVKNYLDNPDRDFWTASYSAALGWKYAAEQFGTFTAEPGVGVDFLTRFWANAENNNSSPDTPGTFDETVKDFDNTSSAKKWFHDFSIANVAKELDVTGLVDAVKYRYIDENDGNGVTYSNVARTWSGNILPLRQANSNVTRWGARYFEANIVECPRGSIVGFRAVGDLAAWGLLAVKGTDQVESLIKGVTSDFAKAFIQPLRSQDDVYTRLIATVAGRDDAANFEYTFDCAQGAIDIIRPSSSYPAYVGEFDEPETFLVRLLVTGPTTLGDPTVFGLQPDDFTVYVGTNGDPADEAPVITGANVQGEYWLVAQAPTKPANATFDLHVLLGDTLMDTEKDAVRYEVLVLDQVLVVDTSGSMSSPASAPKIEAARNAASLFVDVLGGSDRVGLVSFSGDNSEPNDDAILQEILADATAGKRTAVKNKIAGLGAAGLTSIGDGLAKARTEFSIRGSALGEDWIVLLSDGMENEALRWTDVEAAIKADGIRIESIALGPDTDQVLLQEMATETGGDYYYVDVGTAASSAPSAAGGGLPAAASAALANRLADGYALSSEAIKRFERLWEVDGLLVTPATRSYSIPVGEGGIADATFAFNWADSGDDLAVEIKRPDGNVVTDGVAGARIYTDKTHYVAQLPALPGGEWTVNLRATAGAPDYKGILSGKDMRGAALDLYFAQYQSSSEAAGTGAKFLRGLPQPILATLLDRKGPVKGAAMYATIDHPDGDSNVLPLYDDGGHGDGNPNDGVYGNLYTRTTIASEANLADAPGNGVRGSYNVTLETRGRDNVGGRFTRIRKGSFQIWETREKPDFDDDEMPDRYEDLHPCLDKTKPDGAGDPDFDDLRSIEEWKLGTDPCHPDTDRGGETDFSEVKRGANPFDPDDDIVPRPVDVEVVDWRLEHLPFPDGIKLQRNANLIRYPLHPSYSEMMILRSLNPKGPFVPVAALSGSRLTGIYADEGLVNGTPYYYKVQPLDASGNRGTPSHVFSGTPGAEPEPPIGGILIDGGISVTASTASTLELTASSDTDEMMLANAATFAGSVWEPYKPTRPWLLVPDPLTRVAAVFVKYRDPAGNVSSVLQDSILVVAPGTVGGIKGLAKFGDGGDPSGILVTIVGPSGAAPGFTNPSAMFTLSALPPGVYSVQLSYDGYDPVVVTGVVVNAGLVTDIGAHVLERTVVEPPAEAKVPTLNTLAQVLLVLLVLLTGLLYARSYGRD